MEEILRRLSVYRPWGCLRGNLQDEAQDSTGNGRAIPETGMQEEEQFSGEGLRALEFQGWQGTQMWCHSAQVETEWCVWVRA